MTNFTSAAGAAAWIAFSALLASLALQPVATNEVHAATTYASACTADDGCGTEAA